MRRLSVLAGVLLAAIGVASAGSPGAPGAERPRQAPPALRSVGSCEGLRTYLRRHRHALRHGGPVLADGALGELADGEFAAATGGDAPPAPAGTNVQEEGIDEPDIVKTDGTTIFAVEGARLRSVAVGGESPRRLDSLLLPLGPGAEPGYDEFELLLSGDRVLAIAEVYGGYDYEGRTILAEVDVADPARMQVLRTALVEGSFVSARLSGVTARVVTSAYPPLPIAERGHGRALVPGLVLRDRRTGQRRRQKLVGCADVNRPSRFAGGEMLTVQTIDMEQGLPAIDTDSVLTGGQIVYASASSLYVATERWLPPSADPDRISEVETEIHRFDVSDPEATEYVASGEVTGFMLSQWSLSEHEGMLRVASTTAPPWDESGPRRESQSFVTVLETEGERLHEVGSVGGLGRGESIYAVRFIGEVGYVVTFRQVDPLYTLDLSDPLRPRIVGELKIPGYSSYLHPVGEGLLLGVGQDADAEGRTLGVQASLFDVSDPASPTRLDTEQIGGRHSYSEVEYDHHAFGFFAEHGLALIPFESYHDAEEFYGAVGLRLDPEGPDPIGRVAKLAHGLSWEARIRRSLALGDRVYTLSGKGLAAHDPATLGRLAFLDL